MSLKIANAAGFLGDRLDAPRRLVEAAAVHYLTLEYLAELTMSILSAQRQHDPRRGYAGDLIEVLASLAPQLVRQEQLKIVTNGGGVNPRSAAAAAGQVLVEGGLGELSVGVVTGDDLLGRLDEIQAAGCPLANLDTGQPLAELKHPVVCANAYLGAAGIVEALQEQARLVITGRVADASLTLAPAVHEFGWAWDDWHALAGGSVAGHLIECGAQVTGGYSQLWTRWDLTDVGYPIAELAADGTATITKPAGSGGVVNRQTVVEQLVYEIGDPARYVTPDVVVDVTTVEMEDTGGDRVAVRGATGRPATDSYKVSLAYHDGYSASGQMVVFGRDCLAKARAASDMILARVKSAGFELDAARVELLGAGDAVAGLVEPPAGVREVVLRIAVRDGRQEAVRQFTRQWAPLITSGPAGLAGYAGSRSPVRPVFAFWPALVPKELVRPSVEVRRASEWAGEEAD